MNMRICLILCVLAISTQSVRADVTARVEADHIVMQNESLRIAIDPKVGGRIVEYVFKPFGEENLCFPAENNGGMLMDMFWQHGWPGELLKNPYEYEIVKAGPDEAVVRVWRVSTGEAKGKMIQDVAGIRVQRTIRLRRGERALRCNVSLINTQDVGKLVGYWIQNNFYLLGDRKNNQWYRPTRHGVDLISTEKPSSHYWYFVEGPTAGWVGVANRELNGGLMLLMDYNDLWKHYNNMAAVTTEWFYDRVAIPPSKAWQTDVTIIPTPGLSGYAFGSEHLIAQMDLEKTAGGMKVSHRLTAGSTGLKDVTITTHAHGARQPWETSKITKQIKVVDSSVQAIDVDLAGVESDPVIVQVEVIGTTPQGESITLRYGDYFGGAAGKNIDLITLGPLYAFERPAKQKVFLKPDKIIKTVNDHLRVLFVRGLWHEYSGVDEALAKVPEVEVINSWYTESGTGSSLLNFPPGYETLMGYDVVVLANIDGGALGGVGQEMLVDFVNAGGGLLIIGGDRTYGQARFDNKKFVNMLPVQLQGPSDWRRRPSESGILSDGDISFDSTAVLYQHLLNPVADARVTLRAGDAPLIITRREGKGTVIASLALPFGEPAPPSVGYWESPMWHELIRRLITSAAADAENSR